ncbi:P-II family nitrogen regulator [bacterium]|nr:P-II family nitrogen regulator [bacterium]RQV96895.1 MAG: P-II family nitrogen regulator [bacterium]
MKLIVAIIQPHQLPAVKKSLYEKQVYKITVSNVLGCGEEKGYQESFRGVQHEVDLLKKIRLEIAVNEDFVEPTIAAVVDGARTNTVGDGKIFIMDLQECIRIRTGERGNRAIG